MIQIKIPDALFRLSPAAAMFSLALLQPAEACFPDRNLNRMEVRCSVDSVRGRNCTSVRGMSLLSVGDVHGSLYGWWMGKHLNRI